MCLPLGRGTQVDEPKLDPAIRAEGNLRVGHHLMAFFSGCAIQPISDSTRLLQILRHAVLLAGLTEVDHLAHAFKPQGVTCVLVLAQSHLVCHSWPEHRSLVLDLFACSAERQLPQVAELVRDAVEAESIAVEVRERRW